MSSSNQRPANSGFRAVLRCDMTHYHDFRSLSAPEPICNIHLINKTRGWEALRRDAATAALSKE